MFSRFYNSVPLNYNISRHETLVQFFQVGLSIQVPAHSDLVCRLPLFELFSVMGAGGVNPRWRTF